MTPTRKRRLAKVATATEAVERAILTLRRDQVASFKDPNDQQAARRAASEDMAALYYLSRLARKAP